MNCSEVRAALAQPISDPTIQHLVDDHIATCPMCADEQADPLSLAIKPNSAIPPPALASRIMAQLPATPALANIQVQRKQQRRRVAAAITLLAIALVLAIGSYGVFFNSNSPATLFGGSDSVLGRGVLALTLAGKPMVGSLISLGLPVFIGVGVLVGVALMMWKRLAQPTAALLMEVER